MKGEENNIYVLSFVLEHGCYSQINILLLDNHIGGEGKEANCYVKITKGEKI